MRREYERVTCPACERTISAYVPHCGDGSDVRIVPHNSSPGQQGGTRCDASDRLRGEFLASQRLLADLRVSR